MAAEAIGSQIPPLPPFGKGGAGGICSKPSSPNLCWLRASIKRKNMTASLIETC
jgi:hypothetical protein